MTELELVLFRQPRRCWQEATPAAVLVRVTLLMGDWSGCQRKSCDFHWTVYSFLDWILGFRAGWQHRGDKQGT